MGIDFSTAYVGPAVDEGRMNAKQFAPALFAMAGLVERAGRVVHPENGPLIVEVNANFRRGSFEYQLAAVAAVVGQQVLSTWSSAGIEALLDSVGLLPKFKRTRPKSLVDVVEMAGAGQLLGSEARADGNVNIRSQGDNAKVVVINGLLPEVARLVADPEVRDQLSDVMQPLRSPGIDGFRIGAENEPHRLIRKVEAPRFLPPPPPRESLTDSTTRTAVEVLSPSFVDGNKWRVSQGGEPFWLRITDEEFLKRIDSGEQFAKGDYLIVDMRMQAFKTPDGIDMQREAVRVERHERRAPHQGGLF